YAGRVQISGGSGVEAIAAIGNAGSDVNLTLTGLPGSGNITLTGGSNSSSAGSLGFPADALIGSIGGNATVTIHSQAGITLNKGPGGDAAIGSAGFGGLLFGLGGNVSLTAASGDIALNNGVISTNGCVTLQATGTGAQITQSAAGVVKAGSLTTNSTATTN